MKTEIKEKIEEIRHKVDALTLRERTLILITTIVALYSIWSLLLYGYFLSSEIETEKSTKRVRDQIVMLQTQMGTLYQAIGQDTTSSLMNRIKDLKQQNSDLKDKITEQTNKLISPKDMVQVLKHLIDESKELQIITLNNVGTKPLFQSKPGMIQVYKHGILVEFQGKYFDSLNFLQKAEQFPYKMLWEKLSYEVQEYPEAKVSISIGTLGLEEGFVGV
jgi:MSHA biogenesis protein MshJ